MKTMESRLMAKYAQVMVDIVQRIEGGEWKVGDTLPAVPELQERYGFNRLTILKALNRLSHEGYLSVEQGRGTFVKRQQVRTLVGLLFGDDIFNPGSLPFSSLMARAAQDFFHDRRSELKFYIEHSHLRREGVLDRDFVADSESGLLRGVLTVGSNAPRALAESGLWRKRAIPWVDISVFDAAAHRVTIDDAFAMELGFDYFSRVGRRRMAALALAKDEVMDTVTPFREHVQARGMTTQDSWISTVDQPTEAYGYHAMRQIWSGADKPDAILMRDDIAAKGAVQAIQALGIRVPEELAVIGHSNKGSGIFHPIDFPKIEVDPVEMMREAGEMLLALMDAPGLPPKTVSVRPQLREN